MMHLVTMKCLTLASGEICKANAWLL